MPALPRIVCIMGPTASGKTALALALAEALGAEIVGADSVQLYRHFDIGSGKPTPAELARAPHHLIGTFDPRTPCDAGAFAELADAALADIAGRGRPALVVGGTGLYVRALLHGLARVPPVSPAVRERVLAECARLGPAALHARLAEVDPALAARLAPSDAQRITRALEVHEQTGRPLSAFQAPHGFAPRRYDACILAPDWPRPDLQRRIEQRVLGMFADGFVAEVRGLLAAGYPRDLRPMQAVGYRQVVAHVLDGVPLAETVARVQQAQRQYAKRQLTWLRGVPGVQPLPEADPDLALALARRHFDLD